MVSPERSSAKALCPIIQDGPYHSTTAATAGRASVPTWLLLTGDATHLRCGLERVTPMGADFSTNQAVDSLHRIRQLASAHEADVWINHDPEDWKRYGPGPVVLAARSQERTAG